jgi:hypothetical protein
MILLFVLLSCNENEVQDDNLAVYLLVPDTLNAIEAISFPLDSLVLADEPILSLSEIETYDWSDHRFTVNQGAYDRLESLGDVGVSTHGLPFIVMVDDERIFMGAFWALYSSLIPLFPYIQVAPLRLEIQQWHDYDPDPRYDPRIREVLDAAGVLQG